MVGNHYRVGISGMSDQLIYFNGGLTSVRVNKYEVAIENRRRLFSIIS